MSTRTDRIATLGPALVATFDAATVALLAEAAELHAATLIKLDKRTGNGELAREANRLAATASVLRDINLARQILR